MTPRNLLKRIYRRAGYYLLRERGFSFRLHKKTAIFKVPTGPGVESFFGYHDKTPWSFDGRYYLVHLLQGTRPDFAGIGVYDLKERSLKKIAETPLFNYQQGAMLRWLGRDGYELIHNTLVDGALGAEVWDGRSGEKKRVFSLPIQTVNDDGTRALSLNYRRLAATSPEYGYRVEASNFSARMPPEEDGIWRLDLNSGESDLIVTLADLIAGRPFASAGENRHRVNHIIYSPDGGRFAFLHRWSDSTGKGRWSRLFTADADGGDRRLIVEGSIVSHFIWRDPSHLLVWTGGTGGGGYSLFQDGGEGPERFGPGLGRYGDGHPSYSPDGRWVVTDTYPDRRRIRRLLLIDRSGAALEVGAFLSPWAYNGAIRCDLHPRFSPDGSKVSIDSTHEGFRGSYIVDISGLIGRTDD